MKHKIFALLLTAALLLGLLPTATAAGTPTLQFDTTHVWIDLATSAYASVDVTVGGIATAYRLEVQSDVAGLAAHWVNAYMTDGRNTLRLRGSRIGSGELVFRIYSNQDALLLTQTLRIDVIDSTPRLTAEALSIDLTPETVRSLALTAAGTLPAYELRCEARTDCVAAEIDGGALRLTAQKIGHGFVTVGLYAKAGDYQDAATQSRAYYDAYYQEASVGRRAPQRAFSTRRRPATGRTAASILPCRPGCSTARTRGILSRTAA